MSNTSATKPTVAFTLPPKPTKPTDNNDCAIHDLTDDDDGVNSDRRRRERGKKRRRGIRSRLEKLSPAYTLENSGSVARDHLANERTWLAYLRTSLAIASTGVALTQLFTISALRTDSSGKGLLSLGIQRFARPLGATTVALAVVLLALGSYRYFLIQSLLTQDRFPPARKTMGFIAIALSILVTVVFGVLLGFEHR